MTMQTKQEVIKEALDEYLKASKEGKTTILDRIEKTVKMHRKAIVRRFRVLQLREAGVNWNDERGRKVYYGKDTEVALKYLWRIADQICAERLYDGKEEYLIPLIRDKMWPFSDDVTKKIRQMSIGTMKDRIASFERIIPGSARCLTKPSSLKEVIPVRRGPWENPDPGFGEVDTVAHCGNTVEGLFAYTVQYTDVALTWCFLEAQMGKGQAETLESIQAMEERSPFKLLGLDPDSGGEFINWALYDWSMEKKIQLTRIRPGMKNDHGRIEQKNHKNVRKYAGYIRIDTEARLEILKALLKVLEIYINHFLPSMKCIEKIRYNISHSSRRYDRAQTPYQRFMLHPKISDGAKRKMRIFHETLNPKVLHDEIMGLRKKLFEGAKFTRSDI